MGVLVNTSKYLEHAIVLEAHQLLFVWFNFAYSLYFFLENLDNSKVDVVTKYNLTVIKSINIILLGTDQISFLSVTDWAYEFAKTKS